MGASQARIALNDAVDRLLDPGQLECDLPGHAPGTFSNQWIEGGLRVIEFLPSQLKQLLAATHQGAQLLVLRGKRGPPRRLLPQGVIGQKPRIDPICFRAPAPTLPVALGTFGIDQADLMARLVQEGGQGPAVNARLLQGEMTC